MDLTCFPIFFKINYTCTTHTPMPWSTAHTASVLALSSVSFLALSTFLSRRLEARRDMERPAVMNRLMLYFGHRKPSNLSKYVEIIHQCQINVPFFYECIFTVGVDTIYNVRNESALNWQYHCFNPIFYFRTTKLSHTEPSSRGLTN